MAVKRMTASTACSTTHLQKPRPPVCSPAENIWDWSLLAACCRQRSPHKPHVPPPTCGRAPDSKSGAPKLQCTLLHWISLGWVYMLFASFDRALHVHHTAMHSRTPDHALWVQCSYPAYASHKIASVMDQFDRPLTFFWRPYPKVSRRSGSNDIVRFTKYEPKANNDMLNIPNNLPNIQELIKALEEPDFDVIKDQLCILDTPWNTGRNPGTIHRSYLKSKAKLGNTFIKRNIMPTSHNQTVDRDRMVMIHAIFRGTKFNVGQVIAKQLFDACKTDRAILAFPCLISALCRAVEVPTCPRDKCTQFRKGCTKKDCMQKMDLTDVIPIRIAMLATEEEEPHE
ncbi:hypothetical protein GQ457_04G023450 [Hibiscus cannabinus]